MKKKTLYRTKILVEVLSEEPIGSGLTLSEIASEGETGDFSIRTVDIQSDKEVVGKMAVKELEKHGTDLEFFNIDSRGYDTQDDDYEDWSDNVFSTPEQD